MNWIQKAKDRGQWLILVKVIMNFCVPQRQVVTSSAEKLTTFEAQISSTEFV
jgi:hypothetical protein